MLLVLGIYDLTKYLEPFGGQKWDRFAESLDISFPPMSVSIRPKFVWFFEMLLAHFSIIQYPSRLLYPSSGIVP